MQRQISYIFSFLVIKYTNVFSLFPIKFTHLWILFTQSCEYFWDEIYFKNIFLSATTVPHRESHCLSAIGQWLLPWLRHYDITIPLLWGHDLLHCLNQTMVLVTLESCALEQWPGDNGCCYHNNPIVTSHTIVMSSQQLGKQQGIWILTLQQNSLVWLSPITVHSKTCWSYFYQYEISY